MPASINESVDEPSVALQQNETGFISLQFNESTGAEVVDREVYFNIFHLPKDMVYL